MNVLPLLALALVGALVSVAFLVQSRRAGTVCAAVAATPQGTVFLLPNVVWGLLWYAALAAFAVLGGPTWVCWVFLAGSTATLALGAYLVWSLVKVLRTHCALCYTGHAVNVGAFVALVLACA